jgi:DHA1 family bicyclomycin/chloramphenicol resistance-like MFS transporter
MVLGSFTSSKLSRLEENHIIKTAFIVMLLSILCNIFLNSILDDSKIFWVVMPIVIYSFGLHIGQSALTVLALKQFTTNRGSASSINGFINTLLSSCTAGMLSPLFSRSALSLALGQAMIVILGLCCFARAHYLIKNIK